MQVGAPTVIGNDDATGPQRHPGHVDGKVGDRTVAELIAGIYIAAEAQIADRAAVAADRDAPVHPAAIAGLVGDGDVGNGDQHPAAETTRPVVQQGDRVARTEGERIGRRRIRRGGQIVEPDAHNLLDARALTVGAAHADVVGRFVLKIEQGVGP